MRLKDHVMCGWAFIKKEINQDFKEKLTGNIMRDWLNIKNS